MLADLGRWCFRNPWWTAGTWIVGVVLIFGAVLGIGAAFDGKFEVPDSGSRRGFTALDTHFDGFGSGQRGSIVYQTDAGIHDSKVKTEMQEMFAAADSIEGVTISSPYEGIGAATQVNQDRTVAFAVVTLDSELDFTETGEVGLRLIEISPDIDGLEIEIGGQALAEFEPPDSELIGLSFAVIVLIISFGSVLAMGLPIGVTVAGVSSGIALMMLISNLHPVPDFTTQIGAMIGIGVGIDYALFIVTRYREGLKVGQSPEDSTAIALDTAGRAVMFAGITVVISLLGMVVLQLPFITGLAIGAAVTVAFTMIASITLLPALLSFAKERVEVTSWYELWAAGLISLMLLGLGVGFFQALIALPVAVTLFGVGRFIPKLKNRVPQDEPSPIEKTVAYRWSRMIQAHPWVAMFVGSAVLLVLTAPLMSLRLGFSDEGNFAESTTTRQAYDLLAEGFGPGFNGPLIVTAEVSSPSDVATIEVLRTALENTQGVASVDAAFPSDLAEPSRSDAFLIQVVPETSPQDEVTADLVDHLRNNVIPLAVAASTLDVNITGNVAVGIDFSSYLYGRMFLFFGAVLALSFLLLMIVFRSLLVPVKAVVMNMLSIGAAYGVVVVIFQWGWFGSLIGISGGPVEPFIPIMMFAIVFGLSMDYEVFLLSRIREKYDHSGDAAGSVADGLASTARVITAAAAIMVVVFGSFVFEDDRIIKMFGLGLAVAVFLDATVVRMLLVPATMELLGKGNWWLPEWLNRLLPMIHVEGSRDENRTTVNGQS